MTSCDRMRFASCNGSKEPFFNKSSPDFTQQGCHKTVSSLLLPFLGLPDPHICLQSNISGIIWGGELCIPREARLQKIWNKKSQDIMQNLFASMPDRIASCICARGGSTGYDPDIPGYDRYEMRVDHTKSAYTLLVHEARLDDEAEFQCQVSIFLALLQYNSF
ncbi:uncharacterized protein TNCV_4732091 [Trichonephila clavipes]|nr:uncharacterized protein TNCV_4732091 [Trichonephila clavipes]